MFFRMMQVPDKSVDLGGINVVQFLDRSFDLWFVSSDINNEDKCVIIFNFLHCGFCCQWMLYNGIVIKLVGPGSRTTWVLGRSS